METKDDIGVGPAGDQLDKVSSSSSLTEEAADVVPMVEDLNPAEVEEEAEAAKQEIWKNFGRIASARPERKILPVVISSLVRRNPDTNDPEGIKLTTPTGEEIPLGQLLGWDTSHWTDWQSEVVGFASDASKTAKKPSRDAQVQTVPILKKNARTGVAGYGHVKTQTDFGEPDPISQVGMTIFNKPYPAGLVAFVKSVIPEMIAAVTETLIDYGYFGPPEEAELKPNSKEEKEARFALLRSKNPVIPAYRLRSPTIAEGVEARCVSWSPSGTQVAVAHGILRHQGFCQHESVPLTIWALTSSLLRVGPLHEIPFDGCITSVQFHPKLGNLLTFGFFNGDIGLIDLNGEDKQPFGLEIEAMNVTGDVKGVHPSHHEYKYKDMFVVINSVGHLQEVTSLRWVHFNPKDARKLVRKTKNYHSYFIVSTSSDGYISLWSVDKSTSRLSLERRYAILARTIPDFYKRKNRTNFVNIKEIGIQSLDIFKDDPTKFVCSTDGSFLFHGNFLSKTTYSEGELLIGRRGVHDVFDPEAVFIKREADRIQSVSCHPFHESLYIYATLHGNMYIRNTKFIDGEPLLETCFPKRGTFDCKWSTRPMVFAVANDTKVYVYDLLLKAGAEVLSIEHGALCRCLDWSKTEISFLAVTDATGFVNIWKLPEELVQYDTTEAVALNNYADFKEFTEDHKESDDGEDGSDEEEELVMLDAMTRTHFPLLNARFIQIERQGLTSEEESITGPVANL